jgi:hypothetical protein
VSRKKDSNQASRSRRAQRVGSRRSRRSASGRLRGSLGSSPVAFRKVAPPRPGVAVLRP